MKRAVLFCCIVTNLLALVPTGAQIGRRFPSEKKIVPDPVTGVPLTFLTSTPRGDSKIYQTHRQWTSDGKWVIFRSNRVPGQAMAVKEETGEMVQVTESGYSGMLCLAEHSMNLYFLRSQRLSEPVEVVEAQPSDGTRGRRGGRGRRGPSQVIRVDLAKLFADSAAGELKGADEYEHVCGTIPVEMGAGGDMALDPTEEFAYFRVDRNEAAKHLPADVEVAEPFGPRGMGAGPTGLASMNLKTGEVKFIVAVPFQIGHVQTNPWVPGEIVFCWETGGKAPTRMWTVKSDGTGLRPVYPEAPYEWITHEAVITRDEVAMAILCHRRPGTGVDRPDDWGPSGTGEHPTGVGIVNLRSGEMRIVGQAPIDDPGRSVWHVHGSPDGRWAVADDFQYRLWIYDRKSGEMALLADLGHKTRASDHIHPTFSADSTRIEVQTAMLSEDNRSLNICIVPVPESWLNRTYNERLVP
jgi:oligogalacturonide lyase